MSTPPTPLQLQNRVLGMVLFTIDGAEDVMARIISGQPTPQWYIQNALELASQSGPLVRHHSTRLSLMCINGPLSPRTIMLELQDILGTAIPHVLAAARFCDAARYTATFRKDLAWRCSRVLKELRLLILKVPSDGEYLKGPDRSGCLAATGRLLNACEDVTSMANGGIVEHLVKKVEQYRDTLKDVMQELKDWGDETDNDDQNDIAPDYDDDMSSAQAMLDNMMISQQHIPADDPNGIKLRLESCLRRIHLTTILYEAIIKHRLKTLPQLPAPAATDICSKVDEVFSMLRNIPDGFNDVAAAFYELSQADIDNHMDQCFLEASTVSEMVLKPWTEAEKDELSDWALKFQEEIKKDY